MTEYLEPITLGLIPAFMAADLVWRARRFETPRWWRARGLIVTALALLLSIEIALFWAGVFTTSLFDLSGLGTFGGAVVGLLAYELGHYWYHRAAHRFDWLWRAAHQMHHSAEGLDAFGAYYLHPIDVLMFSTISSLVFFPLLGVTAAAGAWAALFLTFNALFQHANIRTPHWLGYLIQRPESHGVHHGRGVHRYNYADLPLWDMAFGTFRNPHQWDGEVGFYNGASARIREMLVGRDVSLPAEAPELWQPVSVASSTLPSPLKSTRIVDDELVASATQSIFDRRTPLIIDAEPAMHAMAAQNDESVDDGPRSSARVA